MTETAALPEDLRRTYKAAVYETRLEAGGVIFRCGRSPEGPAPSGSLAIVTAWNPGHTRPGEAANREANHRLAGEIERSGYAYRPALGRNEEGTHLESSFAITDIPESDAVALGRRFGQAAVFYWDGAQARILPCGD